MEWYLLSWIDEWSLTIVARVIFACGRFLHTTSHNAYDLCTANQWLRHENYYVLAHNIVVINVARWIEFSVGGIWLPPINSRNRWNWNLLLLNLHAANSTSHHKNVYGCKCNCNMVSMDPLLLCKINLFLLWCNWRTNQYAALRLSNIQNNSLNKKWALPTAFDSKFLQA